jgi:hypothetical protein
MAAGPVAEQIELLFLEAIFGLPARAVILFVEGLGLAR